MFPFSSVSFFQCFLFPECLHCAYIYFQCSYLHNTIITLKSCALNAEFQHFFLLFLFSPSSNFISWNSFFYHFFFVPPLTPSFFWEVHTYPNPPTPLLPTNPPTSLILLTPYPPTSFCTHFHRQSFQPRESLTSSKLKEPKIHKSFKGYELQECPSKRSFNVMAEGARKQEELQGGGKSGSLKVSSFLLLLFLFFAFFLL